MKSGRIRNICRRRSKPLTDYLFEKTDINRVEAHLQW